MGNICVEAQLLPYRSDLDVDGWAVPNFNKLKIRSTSEHEVDGGVLKKEQFDVANLKLSTVLSKEPDLEKYCEFRNLHAYSFRGRVFSLSGGCIILFISTYRSTNGKSSLQVKDYMAAYTLYTFYDEDGDGKFERRYNSNPSDKKFEIIIPAWTKK